MMLEDCLRKAIEEGATHYKAKGRYPSVYYVKDGRLFCNDLYLSGEGVKGAGWHRMYPLKRLPKDAIPIENHPALLEGEPLEPRVKPP